jgi:hypothetical protein
MKWFRRFFARPDDAESSSDVVAAEPPAEDPGPAQAWASPLQQPETTATQAEEQPSGRPDDPNP